MGALLNMKRHRWMLLMPYDVTAEDGLRPIGEIPMEDAPPPRQLARGKIPAPDDPRPFFGLHNIVRELMAIVCLDCEQPLTADTAYTNCPGQAPTTADRIVGQRIGGVGRNDSCPCDSGTKFKYCCGA